MSDDENFEPECLFGRPRRATFGQIITAGQGTCKEIPGDATGICAALARMVPATLRPQSRHGRCKKEDRPDMRKDFPKTAPFEENFPYESPVVCRWAGRLDPLGPVGHASER